MNPVSVYLRVVGICSEGQDPDLDPDVKPARCVRKGPPKRYPLVKHWYSWKKRMSYLDDQDRIIKVTAHLTFTYNFRKIPIRILQANASLTCVIVEGP